MTSSWQLALMLAWRFRGSKQKNGFISFISASSTLGIGLGCFVLIVLLSVMNGFEKALRTQLLSIVPHGEVWSVGEQGLADWQVHLDRLRTERGLAHIEPFIKVTGMLQKGQRMKATELTAIAMQYAEQGALVERIDPEVWQTFKQRQDTVILGRGIMQRLGLQPGDSVQLLLPQQSEALRLKAPKVTWLTVAGGFGVGGELDNQLGLLHLEHAAGLLQIEEGAKGLRFEFADPFTAPVRMRDIGYSFDQYLYLSDWTRTQGHLYQDIQLVRTVVYIALTLVIAVACFNIVSTLVMAVSEKQAEIAVLKTMGAGNQLVAFSFMLQGLVNGILGTVIGVALGTIAALNLTEMARWLESLLGVSFLSGDIYFVDFLPSHLIWSEVWYTGAIAITLSILATLYPARRASRIDPAVALSYH